MAGNMARVISFEEARQQREKRRQASNPAPVMLVWYPVWYWVPMWPTA